MTLGWVTWLGDPLMSIKNRANKVNRSSGQIGTPVRKQGMQECSIWMEKFIYSYYSLWPDCFEIYMQYPSECACSKADVGIWKEDEVTAGRLLSTPAYPSLPKFHWALSLASSELELASHWYQSELFNSPPQSHPPCEKPTGRKLSLCGLSSCYKHGGSPAFHLQKGCSWILTGGRCYHRIFVDQTLKPKDIRQC